MTAEEPLQLAPSDSYALHNLSAAMQLQSGACNLFLVHCEGENLAEHIFVMSLEAGDCMLPVPKQQSQDQNYIIQLIATQDTVLAPCAQADEAAWHKRWEEALSSEFSQIDAGDAPYYLNFIQAAQATEEARRSMNQENQSMVHRELTDKLDELGALAAIHLKGTAQVQEELDALYLAMQEIAKQYRLPYDGPKDVLLDATLSPVQRVEQFCERSNWRMRPVMLDADFAQQSAMPLLAFRQSTGTAIVLFPSSQGSTYIDPAVSNKKQVLTRALIKDIEQQAFCFYELLPAGKLTKAKLAKFIFARARNILIMTLAVGLLGSLLGLISPVATAYITSHIIPTANLPELWQLSILLIVLLACQTLLGVVPSLISMIFSARQFERFQAAVFDHILRIPVHALKRCDAGDMTQRILGANQIQSTLFSLVSQQFLGSIFALTSLAMMFFYSPAMTLAGVGMVILFAIGFLILARFNLKPLAAHAAASGRLSGLMKQFFDGVSKIRSAGAEQRVISRFMDDFSVTTKEEYKISTLGAYQSIFTTAFPTLIALIFYAMAGGLMKQEISFPIFLAFMAAFQNFQGGVMGLASGLWTLQAIKPELDRIMPILEEEVEDDHDKHLPGKLDGDIQISHLNFRYKAEAPLVLHDVSIHAKAGEFIAIVGPSGAGKSSLVRLLLGFEQYESGGIYYSGKELAHLNLRAVRRQMGVILQNSKVMPSSILENIATGTQFSTEEAFDALRLAAFEDEVRDLPMGIHTMVNPSTISGGQQQRILIARALIGKPVAVIMDESTSALDNIAQQTIKNNMEQLKMTRIVIAHRLSTIINADRIYVLDQGRVVDQGTYQELAAREGVFKDLVTRQQLASNKSS